MPRQTGVGGKTGIVTTLYSESIFQGQTEVDLLITVAHPNGLFYVVLIAPESEGRYANDAFDRMIRSVRLQF